MSKGTVREYDSSRGCGVIIDFDTKQELTVYANYIDLKTGEIFQEGQDVEYEIEPNRHRSWAVHVTIV